MNHAGMFFAFILIHTNLLTGKGNFCIIKIRPYRRKLANFVRTHDKGGFTKCTASNRDVNIER